MTLFYDPATRKVKPWVWIVIGFIPILLIILVFVLGDMKVKQNKSQQAESPDKDIF